MTGVLALIFGFMVLMIILKYGHLLFINIFSLLVVVAISFGVGYGIAVLITALLTPLLKAIVLILSVIFALVILGIVPRKGE